jgi:hypothetical protein
MLDLSFNDSARLFADKPNGPYRNVIDIVARYSIKGHLPRAKYQIVERFFVVLVPEGR